MGAKWALIDSPGTVVITYLHTVFTVPRSVALTAGQSFLSRLLFMPPLDRTLPAPISSGSPRGPPDAQLQPSLSRSGPVLPLPRLLRRIEGAGSAVPALARGASPNMCSLPGRACAGGAWLASWTCGARGRGATVHGTILGEREYLRESRTARRGGAGTARAMWIYMHAPGTEEAWASCCIGCGEGDYRSDLLRHHPPDASSPSCFWSAAIWRRSLHPRAA